MEEVFRDCFKDHINDKVIGFSILESDNKGVHRYKMVSTLNVLIAFPYNIYEYNRVEYIDPKKCLKEKKNNSGVIFLDGKTAIYFPRDAFSVFCHERYILFYMDSKCSRIHIDPDVKLYKKNDIVAGRFSVGERNISFFDKMTLEIERIVNGEKLIFTIDYGVKYKLYHESKGVMKTFSIPSRTIEFLRNALRRKFKCTGYQHNSVQYPVLQPTFFEESIRFISRYKTAFENLINSEKYS